MSKQRLGVEMEVLSSENRKILMKGMILRRLSHGRPFVKQQLDTAMEQDFIELLRRHRTFDFEAYTGVNLGTFMTSMTVAMLISVREHNGETLYERGQMADEFMTNLPEDMVYMIEDMPMSTRGIFDDLKSQPENEVTVSVDEFMQSHNKTGKQAIEDERDAWKAWEKRKLGQPSKPKPTTGPIILP